MCGRYTYHLDEWEESFMSLVSGVEPQTSYNICPTQFAPVIRQDGPALLRWGLVPSWAKDEKIASKLINARAETVTEKPSFRSSFKKRRCVVVASGFYEWVGEKGSKVPHYISTVDGNPLLMAGLWAQNGELETFTIITCAANAFMQQLHHRMPVLLTPETAEHWLQTADAALLIPSDIELKAHAVSTRVNSGRVNDPSLIVKQS